MENAILLALVVLITLVALLIVRMHKSTAPEGVQAMLRNEFLTFQSNIHTEMNSAKQGVENAKDVISQSAFQTLNHVKSVGETIQKLVKQQEEAERLGQSLKELLQAPKLRGNYGETILEELLERVLPKGIWERQYHMEGGEVVDCIVRFKDIIVPIDAKFPRDDYARYLEAESDDSKDSRWRRFETAVKTQIASIQSKYIKPDYGTAEFALMFIPSEAVYYETIAESNHHGRPSSIWQYAQDHRVVPVSPNIFYAFLQVILLSLRNVEIVRNARQLQGQLASLERDFGLFQARFQEVGRAIGRASEAYRVGDGHVERYKVHLDRVLSLGVPDDHIRSVASNEAKYRQDQ